MKKKQKGLLLMSATALCTALCGGVLLNQSVQANMSSFAMEEGASVRISTDKADAGIRFTAQIGEVEQGAQYGMLIVRNDWLTAWNITDNYVPQVQEKFDNLAVNQDQDDTNDVTAPIKEATPFQDAEDGNKWKIRGSLIGVLEDNYDQEFFGIAYKKVGNDYTYATVENAGDNVRSISDVALGAMIDDTEAKNNTDDAQTCFEFYTGDAKRVKNVQLTVAEENADKDLTFEIKATETYKQATSAIDFAITGDKNASLNLNSESAMDGEFVVESEAGADGWYTVTVNGDLYETGNTLTITVADQLVMRNLNWTAHNNYAITADSSVSLLTPKTVDGKDHEFKKSQALTVNASDKAWTIESANGAVASASGNTVNAVGSGDTSVVVKSRFATSAAIPVRVSYPISSADDLDYLAMVTYTHSKADATKYLSANYLFTNDIDYSEHDRNYILPIASVNHEHGRYVWKNNAWVQGEDYDDNKLGFALGGLTRGTYYSVGWKDVLGLEEVTTTVGSTANVYYLKNTSESKAKYQEEGVTYGTYEDEFRGINPNGLAFAGRMDGNGYAIQNAYYMLDNLQGQPINPDSKGYTGLGGFFVGYNTGTIENLEMHVSIANPANYYYNGGKYGTTQTNNSLKINELYLNEGKTAQKFFLHSTGGVHTALTGKYNPHKGSQGIGATGVVAVNNGIMQNLYHKVNVYASIAETQMAAQGVIASVNGYKITNCVVDRFDNAYLTGEATLATKTLDAKAGNDGAKPVRYGLVGEIKGSDISGCYSLLKREGTSTAYKAIPKALTFSETDYDGLYCGGTIDTLSNTVFTNFTGTTAVQNWNADYAAMYQTYQTNNNLSTVIWNITPNAASISLNDGLTSVR